MMTMRCLSINSDDPSTLPKNFLHPEVKMLQRKVQKYRPTATASWGHTQTTLTSKGEIGGLAKCQQYLSTKSEGEGGCLKILKIPVNLVYECPLEGIPLLTSVIMNTPSTYFSNNFRRFRAIFLAI